MKNFYLFASLLFSCIACFAQPKVSRIVFFRMDAGVNQHTSSFGERRLYTDMIMRDDEKVSGIRACKVFVYNDTDISGTYYLRPYVNRVSFAHTVANINAAPGTIVFIKFHLSSETPIISGAEIVDLQDVMTCYQKNKWLRKQLRKAGYSSIAQLTDGLTPYNEKGAKENSYVLNDTAWYSETGEKISSRDGAYSFAMVTTEKGHLYSIKEYYAHNNQLMLDGYLSSIAPIKREGEFVKYYKSGNVDKKYYYKDDTAEGVWYYYHDSVPVLWYTETYANGEKRELNSYYADGKLKRKQIYADKQVPSGRCYNEAGAEIPFTPFEKMPEATYDLKEYLTRTIKYPPRARANNVQGRVLVKFTVDEHGKITDVKVAKGLSPDTDIEALRVVSHMPPWKPALQDDKPVKVYYNLPIRFTLK